MKNSNKLVIIKEILEKNLGVGIKELERSYEKHKSNIELCNNNIEYMKNIKKICEAILEENSANNCDKSFISVITSKSNLNNSKISENKILYERKKTPMRSNIKIENESRSTMKNREELLKKNLSKPKSRNNSNANLNNNTLINNKLNKSNSNIRNLNKSLKTQDRGISDDHNKNSLLKTPNSKKRFEDREKKTPFVLNKDKEISSNNNTISNTSSSINTLIKKPSAKRLSNDFGRNVTPGKNKTNTTQSHIPNGKTPVKNILNISHVKKPKIEEDQSQTTKEKDKNLKRLNSKKTISSNIVQKATNFPKNKTSLTGATITNLNSNANLNKSTNIKKVEKSGDETQINYIDTDVNDREKKYKFHQMSKNEFIDPDKELNVSNIIQMESNISDDLLLYNKEDQFLNSEFQNKGINFLNKINMMSSPKVKNFGNKLESEEILDDKWENISKFLSLKDISILSITNKKIGKNSILCIIDELEKEKLFFEEKVLSSSFSEDQAISNREEVSFAKENFEVSKPSKKAINLLNDNVLNKLFNETKNIPNNDIIFIYRLYFQLINHEVCRRSLTRPQFWHFVCNFIIKEGSGKTGNLISSKLEKNLDSSPANLFKLNRLIRNNQHKLNPTYFSDICGTSGLITFFLKDALEYLGAISTKNTCQTRILKNAVLMSDYLSSKIEHLKLLLEKIYNY